jgi:hypothetical protein
VIARIIHHKSKKNVNDGIIVVADQPCPPPKDPSPYCNTPAAENSKNCWDVRDYSEDTGLYPCNDGTHKTDWRDCEDVSGKYKDFCKKNPLVKECYHKEKDDDDKTKVVHKTTVIRGASASASATATATANAAEISSCRLDGNAHGIQQKFDSIKYRACGLYPNGQTAYTDGFVVGCTQVGNTQQLCQAFVAMNTQPTQTAATQPQTQPNMQSTPQPTQPIQPSDVS